MRISAVCWPKSGAGCSNCAGCTKSEKFIVINSSSTLSDEYRLISSEKPLSSPKVFQPRLKGLEYSIYHKDDLFYILTNEDHHNFSLKTCNINSTEKENWNTYINGELATCTRVKVNGPRCQFVECEKDEFGTPKDIRGSTAKQYDMTLWPGMELVGCSRKTKGPILNGCIYVVEYVDSTHVTLRLHQDYHAVTKFDQPHIRTALAPLLPEVKKL